MSYVYVFITGFAACLLATLAIKKIAIAFDITDKPTVARKIHLKPVPLLGGVGIYGAFIFVCGILLSLPTTRELLIGRHVEYIHIAGLLLGGFFLVVGGALDDIYNLKPYQQFIFPLLASIVIIISGIGATTITNPFGGVVTLNALWSAVLTFIWLLTTIYTTKFLDGLDGLASGITIIGSVIIALLSIFFFINPPTATLAVLVAGVYAGFLVLNFNPAKIFLGEAGSTLAGYFLGVLAVISGAKLATALLILGIPILDAAHVIFRRLVIERTSPFKGDRKHIHFRLYDMGCTQRQTVAILYFVAAFFGIAALFMQSSQKVTALVAVFLLMILLSITLARRVP